jgi:hypothetical protein
MHQRSWIFFLFLFKEDIERETHYLNSPCPGHCHGQADDPHTRTRRKNKNDTPRAHNENATISGQFLAFSD